MIIVVKKLGDEKRLNELTDWVRSHGAEVNVVHGERSSVVEVFGNESCLDTDYVYSLDFVESVVGENRPYKKVGRKYHPENTVVNVGGCLFGGENFQIIAGPCAVESEKQIIDTAFAVKNCGATLLRGGAYKPRTSPYSFQGLHEEGLKLLLKAKQETGLPVVSEITGVKQLDLFADVDLLQIGARNMQNFELLKEVGKTGKPVLLKRGFANTIEEWLLSAEYLMNEGLQQVILCERGIRTFERYTRNTLDVSAIALLKHMTHLPVIADPSHACGNASLVKPLSLAATAVGADGLIVEVHCNPQRAFSDGAQSLRPEQLAEVVDDVARILPLSGKRFGNR